MEECTGISGAEATILGQDMWLLDGLRAVFIFPFFHALFANLWSRVRAVEAVPHRVVGDGSDVSDLVEEGLPVFASVGLK